MFQVATLCEHNRFRPTLRKAIRKKLAAFEAVK